EQAERERREVQLRNEKFQNDRQPFDVKKFNMVSSCQFNYFLNC
ncbi:unnamed protein product, partial [Rotaria sp. Silwood1]